MKRLIFFAILCSVVFNANFIVHAAIIMPYLIGDNMVVQRETDVPIWGIGEPGGEVTVEFNGQKISTFADDGEGKWSAVLKPMKANAAPQEMIIHNSNGVFKIKNVVVGDVWIYAAHFYIGGRLKKPESSEGGNSDAINYPEIRLFEVKRFISKEPKIMASGSWVACQEEDLEKFPKTAFLFAKKTAVDRKTPVGIIDISCGGSTAEAWIRAEGLNGNPALSHVLQYWDNALKSYPEAKRRWDAEIEKLKQAEQNQGSHKKKNKRPALPDGPDSPGQPSVLYNGMLHPLIPFAVRGIICAQGDANSARFRQYGALFTEMIKDWRSAWNRAELPFIFIQLPACGEPQMLSVESNKSTWPFIREAQTAAVSIPNTAMVMAAQLGDSEKSEETLAGRLYLAAAAAAYGEKNIVCSGPVFESMSFENQKIRVKFKNASNGLIGKNTEVFECDKSSFEGKNVKVTEVPGSAGVFGSGVKMEKKIAEADGSSLKAVRVTVKIPQENPDVKNIREEPVKSVVELENVRELTGFAIAGENRKFLWAKTLIEGDSVVIWNDEIKKPAAVRYNWANNPVGNLHNKEGLPAGTFRTDNWDILYP